LARAQVHNWRLTAIGELVLIAGLPAALFWRAARGILVPWVLQVDSLGEAHAVAPAIANFRPPDLQIPSHLARFIEQMRDIEAYVITVPHNWLRAYDFANEFVALAQHVRNLRISAIAPSLGPKLNWNFQNRGGQRSVGR
jgi:type IV secretion system protein VirB5